jgi:trehalose/maltose transport system permease protein
MATATAVRPAMADISTLSGARHWTIGKVINRLLFWILVVFIIFYTVFPFVWAVISSIKPNAELFKTPVIYWPSQLNWTFYQYVLDNGDFLRALRNSVIVSFSTVAISLVLGSLFTVWVLANFFKAMPGELEEAALVDGATPFQAFVRILLPLAAPGLVTTGLLAFIAAWNEYLYALTFTQTRARTVQPAIASFTGNTQFELPWGNILAASVLVTLPLVVLVLIFQRKILAGLTAGAVKG